jgi:hypothetical protein
MPKSNLYVLFIARTNDKGAKQHPFAIFDSKIKAETYLDYFVEKRGWAPHSFSLKNFNEAQDELPNELLRIY